MKKGFTLLEMLLAVTLSSILLAAGLQVAGGVSRDLAVMQKPHGLEIDGALRLLRHDLANSQAIVEMPGGEGVVLIGSGGIDDRTLQPTSRLVCTQYLIRRHGGAVVLMRKQAFLDDPIRTRPWSEVVGLDVKRILVIPTGGPMQPARLGEETELRVRKVLGLSMESAAASAIQTPSRVRVRIEAFAGDQEQEMVLK